MKILIVDDQAMVRQGIAALLEQDDPATVVLQAAGGAEGVELAAGHGDLDVVFLDLTMPDMDGMAALEAFGRRAPGVPVIVLTASEDAATVRRAFDLGALGYVPKSASARTLLAALRLVLNGDAFVPTLVFGDPPPAAPPGVPPRAGAGRLTGRQAEVLGAMALGLSNKVIGARLGLAEKTVKVHVTNLLRELGATNRTEAVLLAKSRGFI